MEPDFFFDTLPACHLTEGRYTIRRGQPTPQAAVDKKAVRQKRKAERQRKRKNR